MRGNKSNGKSRGRPQRNVHRSASPKLISFIESKYPENISLSTLTAAGKLYGKMKINKYQKILQRLTEGKKSIETYNFIEYLTSKAYSENAKFVSEETLTKMFNSHFNEQQKLIFPQLIKMGETYGVPISQKIAKGIIKKFAADKESLTIKDLIRVNNRRISTLNPKSKPKKQ